MIVAVDCKLCRMWDVTEDKYLRIAHTSRRFPHEVLPYTLKHISIRVAGLNPGIVAGWLLQHLWFQELGGESVFAIGVPGHNLNELLLNPPHPHGFLRPYTACPNGQGSSSILSRLHPVCHHYICEDSIPNDDQFVIVHRAEKRCKVVPNALNTRVPWFGCLVSQDRNL